MKSVIQVQILDKDIWLSLSANAFEKGINMSFLTLSYM